MTPQINTIIITEGRILLGWRQEEIDTVFAKHESLKELTCKSTQNTNIYLQHMLLYVKPLLHTNSGFFVMLLPTNSNDNKHNTFSFNITITVSRYISASVIYIRNHIFFHLNLLCLYDALWENICTLCICIYIYKKSLTPLIYCFC